MSDPIRVLYVDDYPLDRELVRDALEKEHSGFHVTEAASRQEFEMRLVEGGYDIVLSDFNILGFEGLEVIDAVRVKDPRVPVVIVTGTGSEEVAVEAMKRGAADYAIKSPRHIRRLPHTIYAVLERKRLEEERRRAEEALLESEERFRLAFDNAHIGMCLMDLDGHLTRVNDQMCEIFGYSREELEGMTVNDIAHPEDLDIGPQFIQRAISGEIEHTQFEKRYFHKLGHSVWGQVSSSLVRSAQGTPLYFISHVQDITERKRAEERLEEMVKERTKELRGAQEELVSKERLAVLGQLAGGVAHELRNPLGVISNAVFYLQMTHPDADETTKEYLEIIHDEVFNSGRIISDLLDFSRTRFPRREKAAVSELVAQVLEKNPPPGGVEVTTEIALDLPPVFVDPQHMHQVLTNLVINAYQSMPEGGRLTVTAQVERGQMALSVTDTGMGISTQDMGKLFEPLFTTKSRGIGLGLATSKSLVEANEGSIEVKSELGKGSTFTVRLPIKKEVE